MGFKRIRPNRKFAGSAATARHTRMRILFCLLAALIWIPLARGQERRDQGGTAVLQKTAPTPPDRAVSEGTNTSTPSDVPDDVPQAMFPHFSDTVVRRRWRLLAGYVDCYSCTDVNRLPAVIRQSSERRYAMKRSTKDKAKGTLHELKGSAKQKVGRVTRNRQLEAEGVAEKIGGKVQKKIGKVERAFGK